jgi:hypothetical protein
MERVEHRQGYVFHVCQAALMLDFAKSHLDSAHILSENKNVDRELRYALDGLSSLRSSMDIISTMDQEDDKS